MTEAEILRLIRRVSGISQQHDEQATQPDSVTAENYARVVAEVMRRDGIQLNDVDMRNIRIRVLKCWPTVAACRRTGKKQKLRTTGRSRSGYGGNWLNLKQSAKLRWLVGELQICNSTMKLRKIPVVWVVRVTPRFWGLPRYPNKGYRWKKYRFSYVSTEGGIPPSVTR